MDRFDALLLEAAETASASLPRDEVWNAVIAKKHARRGGRRRALRLAASCAACLVLCAVSFYAGRLWAVGKPPPGVTIIEPTVTDPIVNPPQTDGENTVESSGFRRTGVTSLPTA